MATLSDSTVTLSFSDSGSFERSLQRTSELINGETPLEYHERMARESETVSGRNYHHAKAVVMRIHADIDDDRHHAEILADRLEEQGCLADAELVRRLAGIATP